MEQENIINKIRKLLVMAKEATKHEREVAYLKAQEMMAKYHIDMEDVAVTPAELKVVEKVIREVNAKRDVIVALANVIGKNFRCKVYFNSGHRTNWVYTVFMGTELDAEVAAEIFIDATRFARTEAEHIAHYYYNKTGSCDGVRGEWLVGFVSGIRKGFEDQVEKVTATAIMVIVPPEVEAEYNRIKFDKEPLTTLTTNRNGKAALYQAGYQNGYDFSHGRRQRALDSED